MIAILHKSHFSTRGCANAIVINQTKIMSWWLQVGEPDKRNLPARVLMFYDYLQKAMSPLI